MKSKNKFGGNYYQLTKNIVHGKRKVNVGKYRIVKLITKWEGRYR